MDLSKYENKLLGELYELQEEFERVLELQEESLIIEHIKTYIYYKILLFFIQT